MTAAIKPDLDKILCLLRNHDLHYDEQDEAATTKRDAARELLRAVYEEMNEEGPDGPGHCHSVPGVWDMDNRKDLRGKPCEWCALWSRVRAALAAKEPK